MPGLLTQMFDGDPDGATTDLQSSETEAGLSQDLDLGVSVDVGVDMASSYQNLDGSTTEWSNSQDIGLDVDVDHTLDVVLGGGTTKTDTDIAG